MSLGVDEFLHSERVAYFSMEVALRSEIPTYAGGLGVLAGDTVRTAADLDLPLVTVTLVSRAGHFRQVLDPQGRQTETADLWEPSQWATPLGAKIAVAIEGRLVWVGAWLYVLAGHMGGRQPVILLDTALDENERDDRGITDSLYGGDETYRLKQEIVLGIGGVRMLDALGFRVRQYHMNEGHSALLTLALLRRHAYAPDDVRPGESRYDVPRVRDLCNFTTHTPVQAGQDQFAYDLVERILDEFVDLEILKAYAGSDRLNMTRLALNLSEYVNGVAKRHAETSRRMFPGYRVRSITNGVHPHTWTSRPFAELFDHYEPGWCHEPEVLSRAERIGDEAIWEAHARAKQSLLDRVRTQTGATLEAQPLLIGFARRMTAYKRPDLLFSDFERLRAIARERPLQIVLAGKAHPRDGEGKALIARLHEQARALAGEIPVVFLPDYDMALAQTLVAGVDVWLNTPLPPHEASGTSGMKAALNGVPSLSVLDGWWAEGCLEGVTGWAIGNGEAEPDGGDARSLYSKLEEVVLPLYYQDRAGWIEVMKGAIAKNGAVFTSHRMMRRYTSDAYLR